MFAKRGNRTHACICTLNPKSNALTTRPSGLPYPNTIYFNIYTFTKNRTRDLTRTNIIYKHTNIKIDYNIKIDCNIKIALWYDCDVYI